MRFWTFFLTFGLVVLGLWLWGRSEASRQRAYRAALAAMAVVIVVQAGVLVWLVVNGSGLSVVLAAAGLAGVIIGVGVGVLLRREQRADPRLGAYNALSGRERREVNRATRTGVRLPDARRRAALREAVARAADLDPRSFEARVTRGLSSRRALGLHEARSETALEANQD